MFSSKKKYGISGRVVLITGAAHGIGLAVARKIRAKGGIPVCVDLASDALDMLSKELGEGSLVAACDVTDAKGMQEIVEMAVERFGGMDVVVANAGIEKIDPVWIMPEQDFERVLEVNIFGVYRAIRPALVHVMKRKGHIVAVSSVSALVPWPLSAAYGASKACVASLMRSLRMELAGTGTTAGAVYFGNIDTDMMKRATQKPVVNDMFDASPTFGLGAKPRPPELAADRIIENIETRSAIGFSHSEVKFTFILNGLLQLLDDFTAHSTGITGVISKYYGG
ncbi:MAG TPA: SDR family NAD(P)-dependent oxidoreductase [Deltaproteobacteria bacterium]|nr:SDR family NAD(P)-dependent oxidoreductase [Deltaproteobacteria bacterium]HPR51254.1 SDR family NAD(P)-dependent oxidoreductase [Deltaproteobacteria bacterium]